MNFVLPPRLSTQWERFRQDPVNSLIRWSYQARIPVRNPSFTAIPLTLVCVSDTHTTEPSIPEGDVLLHAGDLSKSGTFEEIQLQLDWLNRQPHKYKIAIAGNHDLLLDTAFVDRFPERVLEKPGVCQSDLRWGDVIYLMDRSVILEFPDRNRSLKVYGSPWTMQYGKNWAFQYSPMLDVWSGKIPEDTNILLTHGPPKGHLDLNGHGSHHLMKELWRVKPQMVVFGHVHAGWGQELLQYDYVQAVYDDAVSKNRRLFSALVLALIILVQEVMSIMAIPRRSAGIKTTTLVNAAVVRGGKINLAQPAINVDV